MVMGVAWKIDPRINCEPQGDLELSEIKTLTDVLTGLGFLSGFDFSINQKEIILKRNSL